MITDAPMAALTSSLPTNPTTNGTAAASAEAFPRHVLCGADLTDSDWAHVVTRAVQHRRAGSPPSKAADGRAIGLVFFNPSLRTRTSMERAAQQLGAQATVLTPGEGTWDLAWAEGAVMDGAAAEHVRDAIGVLSRYFDALGVRVFASGTDYEQDRSDTLIRQVADAATVPVVSLESAWHHPCQALADAAVLHDRFDGALQGRRFVLHWAPHPKALPMAVPNSALLMAARHGMDVTVACPDTHPLDADVMDEAAALADARGGRVRATADPDAAAEGADVVYAKSWGGPLAYTDPDQEAAARADATGWRVTAERMAATEEGTFMHCLPVRRNVVADDAVLDGPHALHLDQAEYRLHAQRALLECVWDV
jgi:N-acetylornithine carbamoyltransferase